jgi:hypothetical protein
MRGPGSTWREKHARGPSISELVSITRRLASGRETMNAEAHMSEGLDRIVARMNIGHFHERLAEERDGRKRETILLLLQEEEQKLAGVPQGGQACGLLSLSRRHE